MRRHEQDIILLGLYVDDILIAHNCADLTQSIIHSLNSKFDTTDIGEPSRLLGMNVAINRESGTVSINQSTYIQELMSKFNMTNVKPIKTPHQPGVLLTKNTCPSCQPDYGSLVGALNYISTHTRPDIATAVGSLCRYISDPGSLHWTAAKRVLQYLSGTASFGITYRRDGNHRLDTYSDSDWGQDIDTRRSTTGYIIKLAGAPISCKSKR